MCSSDVWDIYGQSDEQLLKDIAALHLQDAVNGPEGEGPGQRALSAKAMLTRAVAMRPL